MSTAIIIDDYAEYAELIGKYLELLGLRSLAIGRNGKEAIDLYQKLRPSFVLLNVQMPDYDGYYALSKIRMFNPSAIVIMVTADTSYETRRKLVLLGATDILYKPVDYNLMKEIITRHNMQAVSMT